MGRSSLDRGDAAGCCNLRPGDAPGRSSTGTIHVQSTMVILMPTPQARRPAPAGRRPVSSCTCWRWWGSRGKTVGAGAATPQTAGHHRLRRHRPGSAGQQQGVGYGCGGSAAPSLSRRLSGGGHAGQARQDERADRARRHRPAAGQSRHWLVREANARTGHTCTISGWSAGRYGGKDPRHAASLPASPRGHNNCFLVSRPSWAAHRACRSGDGLGSLPSRIMRGKQPGSEGPDAQQRCDPAGLPKARAPPQGLAKRRDVQVPHLQPRLARALPLQVQVARLGRLRSPGPRAGSGRPPWANHRSPSRFSMTAALTGWRGNVSGRRPVRTWSNCERRPRARRCCAGAGHLVDDHEPFCRQSAHSIAYRSGRLLQIWDQSFLIHD